MNDPNLVLRVVDSLQESVLVIDRDYRIININQTCCRDYGKSKKEMIGQPCYQITHHCDQPCYLSHMPCPVRNVFLSGKTSRVVHQHFLADGQYYWHEIIASPILGSDGEVLCVVEEMRDVSELLRTKEIVQELTSEVKVLKGILPICANCKKIRTDEGRWENIEVYMHKHSEAEFSHGLCPDCTQTLYSSLGIDRNS